MTAPALGGGRIEREGETYVQKENVPDGVEFVTEDEGVREYRLANGLKLLLVENRVAPVWPTASLREPTR